MGGVAPVREHGLQGDVVARARSFAERSHGAQVRKYSKQPYIVHLDAVAEVLRSYQITEPTVLAAAYLHDVVEDTQATMQHVFDAFGEEIAELVYWLTDAETGKRRIRKIMSAWRLGQAPWNAKLIKLADFIDDTEDIVRNDPHFAPVYMREGRRILERMLDAEGDKLERLALYQEASRLLHLPVQPAD